ncbi:MAG TPA: hypothetical protein VEB20_14515 [Azospirillaceae bacterium]|nr:hypothetical protein [Azospirillaceae bacterium]
MMDGYIDLAETALPLPDFAEGAELPATPVPAPTGYYFALDSERRIAWPFRVARLPDGVLRAERWRFGRWVGGAELAPLVNGEDDLWIETTADEAAAWIAREMRRFGIRPAA